MDPPERGWCQCSPELKSGSKGSICGVWMELVRAGWADHAHVPTRLLIVWDRAGMAEKETGYWAETGYIAEIRVCSSQVINSGTEP